MDKDAIKRASKMGLGGIFDVYFSLRPYTNSVKNRGEFFRRAEILWHFYWAPFLLSLSLTISIYFTEQTPYELLKLINGKALDLLPNILGFNLGGYTLFVAFGGNEFLQKIVDFKDDDRSIYQKNSAIFAVTLILQILTLVMTYVIGILIDFELNCKNVFFANAVNVSIIFVELLLSIVSITILYSIVKNIFNLSQMYHLSLWRRNEEKDSTSNKAS